MKSIRSRISPNTTGTKIPPIKSSPIFFFSSRRRHTRSLCDWSSEVCSSDLDEPREHHFFPRLVAPFHVDLRIGIRLVRRRVVVMRDRTDPGPLRKLERFSEDVVGLPVEIVLGHGQDD